jgi:23S rRNA pseudouridine1911/1915/1917 synthase
LSAPASARGHFSAYCPGVQLSIPPNPRIVCKVRFEDEDLLVVDKPARLVTQPGLGHETDTLMNGLFATHGQRLQNLGRMRDFGLLHRLDRQTSGLVLIALRPRAYDALREAFETRQVRKYYWAVTARAPKKASGLIRRPILEVTGTKKLARISAAGKPALTAYRVLQDSPRAALLECRLVTGRLHQIRVHLESIGCPILGDDFYAPKAVVAAAPRLALHAHRLVVQHPGTGKTIDVHSPWPKDLSPLLRRMLLEKPKAVSSAEAGHEIGSDGVGDEES